MHHGVNRLYGQNQADQTRRNQGNAKPIWRIFNQFIRRRGIHSQTKFFVRLTKIGNINRQFTEFIQFIVVSELMQKIRRPARMEPIVYVFQPAIWGFGP